MILQEPDEIWGDCKDDGVGSTSSSGPGVCCFTFYLISSERKQHIALHTNPHPVLLSA